ncbi:MAG: DNA methylase [Planctomycetes bacterium]|nr:DNA methylase [Planctomycetota bacterium]
MASREKQIQQNYRPIIAVHKWFARRPGTLFRALLLAEFGKRPVREQYFRSNRLPHLRVVDPFMGGGTPLVEANRLGCDVFGYDINPMACWIVRQEIEWLDVEGYRESAARLVHALEAKVWDLYQTRCLHCSTRATAKYFLWVKTQDCVACGKPVDLFPGYVLSEDQRHPRNVLICRKCGELTEVEDREAPGSCRACGELLHVRGPAQRGHCPCLCCGADNRYPSPERGAPRHRMFAIEYHCPRCKPKHVGRFFKRPDRQDLAHYARAESALRRIRPSHVPTEVIPAGDETDRLHRWGYTRYREMFNSRQLLGLEISARWIARQRNVRVRNALATNLSDLLRYQNMLCRYDQTVLKSLDIFAVHGFPVGLIQCESNMLGLTTGRAQGDLFGVGENGASIGSGGWTNIIEKYAKAKTYCARPFEVRGGDRAKTLVFTRDEWIGESRPDDPGAGRREVALQCRSGTECDLPPASVDAVLTDPPYFSNVQYAELMDFCYVWLRRLVGRAESSFRAATTRSADELTGNQTMDRGLGHFAEGLSAVFRGMARALKPGRPMAFTYHNNDLAAYYPIAVGILDSGLVCTATLPCPGEMSASIHISGTGSSVIDSIFVCRVKGRPSADSVKGTAAAVRALVEADCERLRAGNVEPTPGDVRCMAHGHLTRLATWHLRDEWDSGAPIDARLLRVREWMDKMGGAPAVLALLAPKRSPQGRRARRRHEGEPRGWSRRCPRTRLRFRFRNSAPTSTSTWVSWWIRSSPTF